MAELMLINPRKRRRKAKTKSSKKRRGKRRMSALQRKYFGKRKHKRVATVAKKSSKRRRRYAVSAKKSRRYRRNPSKMGKFNIQSFTRNTLMPSAMGAAGALGLDVIMGFLPLPPNFKTGPLKGVVKVAGAVAMGMLASTFVKRSTAEQIAAGAITVALYDTFKGILQTTMPTIPLGSNDDIFSEYPSLAYAAAAEQVGMMDYDAGSDDMGLYVGDEMMGEYVEG